MNADDNRIIALALGRIFLLGSRPTQPGDIEQYEACRRIILDLAEERSTDWTANYVRDRLKGAAGDP